MLPPVNLATIIEGHPGDSVAIVDGRRLISYQALRLQVGVVRGGLARLGVQAGDRVAVVSENDWSYVVTYLAVLGLGAVLVPLNPSSPPPELEAQLSAVTPRVVLVGPGGGDSMAGVSGQRPGRGVDAVLATDGVSVAGARPFSDLFDADPLPPVDVAHDTVAALLHTAGTVGPPRPAMLTHGSLRANLDQVQRHPGRLWPDDVSLCVVPLFHIFGLNGVLGLSLVAGASVVLLGRFDAGSTLAEVAARRVTVVAGPPTMFAAWNAFLPAPAEALSSVRLAVAGAAPLRREVADGFEERFGRPLHQGYGVTEASPVVSSSITGGAPVAGSVGPPLPGVDVRLVDEEGMDALPGDPGEVWVRGANLFAGYWQDDAATDAALTPDGWLRTGDVAVAGDGGELYLVDRTKDLVIVSGFNVYPAEVEAVLLEHPGVAEAAVVGEPHPYSGETVKAYVVAGEPRPTEGELVEHCARRLARYKCPTEVSFVPSLPYGLAGKLLRRALRQPQG
jgi:long-chain acyl-CoA synthetase